MRAARGAPTTANPTGLIPFSAISSPSSASCPTRVLPSRTTTSTLSTAAASGSASMTSLRGEESMITKSARDRASSGNASLK